MTCAYDLHLRPAPTARTYDLSEAKTKEPVDNLRNLRYNGYRTKEREEKKMTKKEAIERIEKFDLIELIERMSITPSSKEALKIACEELKKNEKNY